MNYNDGGVVDTREDTTWQENMSDYNSDFSAPSGGKCYSTIVCHSSSVKNSNVR